MAEEIKPVDAPPVVETPAKSEEKKIDVTALAAELENIKKAQAGSDRAYQEAAKKLSELQTENENLKKEKMSEKERAAFEHQKAVAELEAKAKEVADATLRLSKMKLFGEKQIDIRLADFINGSNEEELKSNLDTFNKLFEEEVGKRVETRLLGTKKPQAGAEKEPEIDYANLSLKDMEKLAAEGKLKPRS